jgi:hypothetical protein
MGTLASLARDLTEAVETLGAELALKRALEMVEHPGELAGGETGEEREGDSLADLRRFAALLALLEANVAHECLAPPMVRRLLKLATSLLEQHDVGPVGSPLSFLHARLGRIASDNAARTGQLLAAMWHAETAAVAQTQGQGPSAAESLLERARHYLRRGDCEAAELCVGKAGVVGLDGAAIPEASMLLARAARLRGCPDRVLPLLGEGEIAAWPESARRAAQWEQYCLAASLEQDLVPMLKAVGRRGTHRRLTYVAEAHLWASAMASTRWSARLPAAQSVAQAFAAELRESQALRALMRAVRALERCRLAQGSPQQRLATLGEVATQGELLPDIGQQLLFLVGATRACVRARQPGFAQLLLGEYRRVSLVVTLGGSGDALNLARDLVLDPTVTAAHADAKPPGERRRQRRLKAVG